MSTPIINLIENSNNETVSTVFEKIANNENAHESLSQSNRNIDAVASSLVATDALASNDEAVRKCICRREGRDPDDFSDFDSIASNSSLMEDISQNVSSCRISTRSQSFIDSAVESDTAMSAIANSEIAMDLVFDSEDIAMDAVANSEIAMDAVIASENAIEAVAASETAMEAVAASETAMEAVADSKTAMEAVAASEVAIQNVTESGLADPIYTDSQFYGDALATFGVDNVSGIGNIDDVFNSETAVDSLIASESGMELMAASETAMGIIAESETFINKIGSSSNENIAQNTILDSSIAASEFNSSSLNSNFSSSFNDAENESGSITNQRVLVTSNNNNGDIGTSISWSTAVGQETNNSTTFIINEANISSGNEFGSGEIGFDGIVIEE